MWVGASWRSRRRNETSGLSKMPLCFVEMLSVAVEIVLYLDLGAVGLLSVGCKEAQQVVKECKFGGEQVLMECRRLLRAQRVEVSRQVGGELCARVVDACAGARSPLCDLVARGWRITASSEVSDVKKLIMEAGNQLTELMRWAAQQCQESRVLMRVRVHGVAVDEVHGVADAQVGHDGRGMKFIGWPRTEWERGVDVVEEQEDDADEEEDDADE